MRGKQRRSITTSAGLDYRWGRRSPKALLWSALITTKIFQGLRRHSGYHLSPRADSNQVLCHLAQEAGWVVEPDGITYRYATTTNTTSSGINVCPLRARGRKRTTIMPTSSFVGANAGIGAVAYGDGGECLTVASPRHITTKGPTALNHSSISLTFCGGFSSCSTTIATIASSSSCPLHSLLKNKASSMDFRFLKPQYLLLIIFTNGIFAITNPLII
ncbi:protein BZR1 homolog 1-like [Olea europaea var. sylvestris]|uniref:protein BZR1 homolog 1-like n=1 Tax=Olea europaea var. sylvestris TaxID=158386 RepID=UPI000C1D6E3B|nr:protein BZR1 homolog 1-like [Olea europaea var. sylvestris]